MRAHGGTALFEAHKRYQTVGKIGEGSFGQVFRGVDRATGAAVAIKKVRLKDTRSLPTRPLREVLSLQHMMDHPNLLPLLNLYTQGSNLMLVLPFVPHNLAALMAARASPMPHREARAISRMLFCGLAYCHSQRIVHRDLKPSNLLLRANGVLLIADFGLARLLPTRGEQVDLSHDVATRWYRAPELLFGARRYGTGVDMWAAGCIVAELLRLCPLVPGVSRAA